jgi:hypothetical protein
MMTHIFMVMVLVVTWLPLTLPRQYMGLHAHVLLWLILTAPFQHKQCTLAVYVETAGFCLIVVLPIFIIKK